MDAYKDLVKIFNELKQADPGWKYRGRARLEVRDYLPPGYAVRTEPEWSEDGKTWTVFVTPVHATALRRSGFSDAQIAEAICEMIDKPIVQERP